MATYELNADDFYDNDAFRAFKCITSLGYTITIPRSEDFDLNKRECMKEFEDWLAEDGIFAFSEYIMNLPVTDINLIVLTKYLKKFHRHLYYALNHRFKTESAIEEYIKHYNTIGDFIRNALLEAEIEKHARFGFREYKL